MQDLTYIYHTPTEDVTITGFIAYLLQQGDAWDMRCLEADAREYHALQYTRMHPTIALKQELQWWLDCALDEWLYDMPLRDDLLSAGLIYLQWRIHEQLSPLSDSEMLNTEMTIRIDEEHMIYKLDHSLGIVEYSAKEPLHIIHGFPAQLLTYAACTTTDAFIRQMDNVDPVVWVDSMSGWLDSPSIVMLCHIRFDIPNVYQLYESYLADARAEWEADNNRRYQSGKPQTRYFMHRLLERTQRECEAAIGSLSLYLSDEQRVACERYLAECQQYISDHVKTKRKERSDELSQYYNKKTAGKSRHLITRRLHEAALHPATPAAELARVVKHLQSQRALVADLRPLTHFIAVVNKTFGTDIKYDSFSKNFRN